MHQASPDESFCLLTLGAGLPIYREHGSKSGGGGPGGSSRSGSARVILSREAALNCRIRRDLPHRSLPAYRRFFFFLGGGGGGFTSTAAATVAACGGGIIRWTTYCWPIVQTLVVIQ
jgi:hypothetical protein